MEWLDSAVVWAAGKDDNGHYDALCPKCGGRAKYLPDTEQFRCPGKCNKTVTKDTARKWVRDHG